MAAIVKMNDSDEIGRNKKQNLQDGRGGMNLPLTESEKTGNIMLGTQHRDSIVSTLGLKCF